MEIININPRISDGKWMNKTPAEIVVDVKTAVMRASANANRTVYPKVMFLPPQAMGFIKTQLVSAVHGQETIFDYLRENVFVGEEKLIIVSTRQQRNRAWDHCMILAHPSTIKCQSIYDGIQ